MKQYTKMPAWAVEMETRFDQKLLDLEARLKRDNINKQELIAIIDQRIEDKLATVKPYWVDAMMVLLDKAAGNYKEVSEEQTILSGRQSVQNDDIELLDKRVTKIEKHLQFAT